MKPGRAKTIFIVLIQISLLYNTEPCRRLGSCSSAHVVLEANKFPPLAALICHIPANRKLGYWYIVSWLESKQPVTTHLIILAEHPDEICPYQPDSDKAQ